MNAKFGSYIKGRTYAELSSRLACSVLQASKKGKKQKAKNDICNPSVVLYRSLQSGM